MALLNACSITNKASLLSDLFTSKNMHFVFITETWQRELEYFHLNELYSADCSYISSSWLTGRGGGVATVFKYCFGCRLVNTDTFPLYEMQMTVLLYFIFIILRVLLAPFL